MLLGMREMYLYYYRNSDFQTIWPDCSELAQ